MMKTRLEQLAKQLSKSANSPRRSMAPPSTSRASEDRNRSTSLLSSRSSPLPSSASFSTLSAGGSNGRGNSGPVAVDGSLLHGRRQLGSSNASEKVKPRGGDGGRSRAAGGLQGRGVRFASSYTIPNGNGGTVDLEFPRKSNPTPWEIFHFDQSDPLPNPRLIKARYFELSRLYHPDTKLSCVPSSPSESAKGKEKATPASDTSKEFRMICSAYEILKSPSKRSVYLRSGYGFSGSHGARASNSRNAGYDFSRGPPMRDGGSAYARGK